jgi:hypothetical protein
VEVWGFLWIMLALKIPLAMLLWLVWWAVRAEPDPESGSDDDDGGGIHKRGNRLPREPQGPRRRGPHGDPTLPPPPRTRTHVRSRERADR